MTTFKFKIVQTEQTTTPNLIISSHKTIEQAQKMLLINNKVSLDKWIKRKIKGIWISPFRIEEIN